MGKFEISSEETKELQNISLRILEYFDSFCREHELTYFLCGGCCIGSVRHGGFIPWDDDVDVFLPRKDYEKLKKEWKDTAKYEIEYADKNSRCNSTSIRICDKDTTFIRTYTQNVDVSHSVSLDVFPLDGCPSGNKRKMQKLWALLFSLYIVEKAPENHGAIVKGIGKIALCLAPVWPIRYRLWKHAEKKMSQYNIEDCDYITELCAGPHYMQNEYPAKAFKEQYFVDFEGRKFPIPCGYDEYLKIAFGDYMTLPPVEERIAHHEYEFMDLNKGYKNYEGIKYGKRR